MWTDQTLFCHLFLPPIIKKKWESLLRFAPVSIHILEEFFTFRQSAQQKNSSRSMPLQSPSHARQCTHFFGKYSRMFKARKKFLMFSPYMMTYDFFVSFWMNWRRVDGYKKAHNLHAKPNYTHMIYTFFVWDTEIDNTLHRVVRNK